MHLGVSVEAMTHSALASLDHMGAYEVSWEFSFQSVQYWWFGDAVAPGLSLAQWNLKTHEGVAALASFHCALGVLDYVLQSFYTM